MLWQCKSCGVWYTLLHAYYESDDGKDHGTTAELVATPQPDGTARVDWWCLRCLQPYIDADLVIAPDARRPTWRLKA